MKKFPKQETTKICITICTRGRPQMLGDCLASILPQLHDREALICTVVVENDCYPRAAKMVRDIAAAFTLCDLQYHLEPELGISAARNRAVEEALEWGADWVVFIDDDEIADPDWFSNLSLAMHDLRADVLHGSVELIYPDDFPQWQRLKTFHAGVRGSLLRTVATNNTAARSWLFAKDQAGLRFDHRLSFSGGEDIDLFHRAHSVGATVRWVPEARVLEQVTGRRLTELWHLKRARRLAANEARHRARRDGALIASITTVLTVLRLACETAFAAMLALTNSLIPRRRSAYLYKSKLKATKMGGYLIGLGGRSLPTYQEVDGH